MTRRRPAGYGAAGRRQMAEDREQTFESGSGKAEGGRLVHRAKGMAHSVNAGKKVGKRISEDEKRRRAEYRKLRG